ncbi:hypothetical protein FRACYDRAFT_250241 [Fragilariopsis cylindrus CCMP1102]|uniref:Uncharacterized protein n=1 Tax=Fragilariopsis cylindrus CCMP1102 TaxID=635003 RepID=A0A1E7EQ16_9STRA|nr:hypothetical protein FRACYDRAFT_250241 [Fragilariopsis cylindrus CCMP1102]|eukprot:OEU08021.1 hypothetical protein FRACYDRAFT_250241 [Fragilariopsis cylindrus CCMP1102]
MKEEADAEEVCNKVEVEKDNGDKKKRRKKKKKILLLVLDATWNHAREMHMANIRLHQYPTNMLRLALEKDDLLIDNNSKEFQPGRFRVRGKASKKGYKKKKKSKKYIKSSNNNAAVLDDEDEDEEPLDGSWMSTAECIAWIVSKIEEQEQGEQQNEHNEHDKRADEKQQTKSSASTIVVDNASGTATTLTSSLSLYEILMKPLDLMVLKWKSFVDNSSNNNNHHKHDR